MLMLGCLRVKCMKLEILIGLVLFKGEILQECLSVFKMYFIQISFNYNFNLCLLQPLSVFQGSFTIRVTY